MTKISKATKLKALQDYSKGDISARQVAKQYGIDSKTMRIMIAAYQNYGADVILNPPKVTPEFRVKLARWAISNNASYTEIAAKFGYIGQLQMRVWKEIYRQKGPNGLLSITKGRKPKMTKNDRRKKAVRCSKKPLTLEQNRIERLEAENLELKIKLAASKLLASMKQQTDKSHK